MENKKWLLKPAYLEPMPLGMQCKPWYKDNLPSKYFAKHKRKLLNFPTALDSRRWRFVKEGLDDFRYGCPSCDDMIIRGRKEGFLPTISNKGSQPARTKKQRALSKDPNLFTTLSIIQQKRKALLEYIDAYFTPHPLAHCTNMEDSLPPELLLKVLEELDPYGELQDAWQYCLGAKEANKSNRKPCVSPPKRSVLPPLEKPRATPPKKAPEIVLDDLLYETKILLEQKPSQTQEEPPKEKYVPKGVRDFCKWAASYGELGIDEDFMMHLFDISSEYKAAYETPHMKKLFQIPPEMKISSVLKVPEMIRFSTDEVKWEKKLKKPKDPYKPHHDKIRYGAWYLKPKLWKKLVNDEPLIDPKIILEEIRKQGEYDILENLYGTIAFKDFILSKGYEMPTLIERLFRRKGWKYDQVNTPMQKVLKMTPLLGDDDCEDA